MTNHFFLEHEIASPEMLSYDNDCWSDLLRRVDNGELNTIFMDGD